MANVEGPVGATLTDALKRVCSSCNGSKFYIANEVDTPGVGELFNILCAQCGHEEALDLKTDMASAENNS